MLNYQQETLCKKYIKIDYLSGNANAIKWSDAGEPTAQ
jgi:hypothetical protein